MARTQEVEHNKLNVIGEGTSIQGNIQSTGDIRIDGSLEGNLNTKGKLVIGTSGNIKGDIECKNAEVSGVIEGKLNVKELLSLKATAKLFGDIITKKLAIEPNAIFTGTCKMDGAMAKPVNAKNDKAEK